MAGTCPTGQVWVCSGESEVPPHGDALGWLLSWGLLPWGHSGKPTLLCRRIPRGMVGAWQEIFKASSDVHLSCGF